MRRQVEGWAIRTNIEGDPDGATDAADVPVAESFCVLNFKMIKSGAVL